MEGEGPMVEWSPLADPEGSLRAAQKKLESDDWETKTEGLNVIRRLAHFHTSIFNPPVLHTIILLVVKEVSAYLLTLLCSFF
jgi:hypothetical protein